MIENIIYIFIGLWFVVALGIWTMGITKNPTELIIKTTIAALALTIALIFTGVIKL